MLGQTGRLGYPHSLVCHRCQFSRFYKPNIVPPHYIIINLVEKKSTRVDGSLMHESYYSLSLKICTTMR